MAEHRPPQSGGNQLTSGQAHMRVGAERDDDTQHRQPQEQCVSQFVSPEQRPVEHVARYDAGEEDEDLGEHPGSPDGLAYRANGAVQHRRRAAQPGPVGCLRCDKRLCFGAHARAPTYCSNSDQA